jgi:hypothetical protein
MCHDGNNAVSIAYRIPVVEIGDGAGRRAMECEMFTDNYNDKEAQGWDRQRQLRLTNVAEVQNIARQILSIALVPWLSGQHLNRPCSSG